VICPGTYTEAVFIAVSFIKDPSFTWVFVTVCIIVRLVFEYTL